VARVWQEDTPAEPKSSIGDDEEEDGDEEGEVTPPPLPSMCETLPSRGDIISR
jgi:hypothetical protein